MNKSSDNRDFWNGRIILIFFFFVILSFSNRVPDSQVDCYTALPEQVVDLNNSATLIEPAGIPNYNISAADLELNDIGNDNIYSDRSFKSIINQQFKCEELRFLSFKPKLLMLHIFPLKISSKDDYSLIS